MVHRVSKKWVFQDYQKWVPVVTRWTCKAVAISMAWLWPKRLGQETAKGMKPENRDIHQKAWGIIGTYGNHWGSHGILYIRINHRLLINLIY